MSKYIIPVLILLLLVVSALRRKNVYSCFTEGAKESLLLIFNIFPYIAAVYVCIYLFKASGMSDILADFLSPLFNFLGIPSELTDIIIIRPLSGNGSLALLEDIYIRYGSDSYIARVASVIMGSSETIFYVAAIYFSTTKVKKIGGAILISLVSSFVGIIFACLLCRWI